MASSLGPGGWEGQKEGGKHPSPPKRVEAVEANAEASRRNGGRRGEASKGGRCAGGSGAGAGVGEGGKGGLDPTLVKKEQDATLPSSLSSGLRPDSFDYLSAEVRGGQTWKQTSARVCGRVVLGVPLMNAVRWESSTVVVTSIPLSTKTLIRA